MIRVIEMTNWVTTNPFRRIIPLVPPMNRPFKTITGLNPDKIIAGYIPATKPTPIEVPNNKEITLRLLNMPGLIDLPAI